MALRISIVKIINELESKSDFYQEEKDGTDDWFLVG